MSNDEYFAELDATGHPFPSLHYQSLNAPKGHRNVLKGMLRDAVTIRIMQENLEKPRVVHIRNILEPRGPM